MADADPSLETLSATVVRLAHVLSAQRASFNIELPVGEAARRGRLDRCIALMKENGDAFAKAMSDDFGHRSHDQSMMTDIAASVSPAKHALKNLSKWMQPEKRNVQFPLGLLGARARVEYQPKGEIGRAHV